MNWLRKTTVGRRCDQKTLLQRFLAQPDGPDGLRPCAANAAQFSSSQSVPISVNKWFQKNRLFPFRFSLCVLRELRVQIPIRIRVHLRSSAVKKSESSVVRMYGSLCVLCDLRVQNPDPWLSVPVLRSFSEVG